MRFKSRIVKTKAGPILLRKVRLSDAHELNRIFNAPQVNRFLLRPPSSLKGTFESIRKDSVPGKLSIVAVLGGQAIGRASLWPEEGRAGHTANFGIMVDVPFHGKGVAKALLDALFETAKENGIEKIDASHIADNGRAARFYKKIGFKIDGVRKGSFKRNGKYVDHVMMSKWL